MLVHEYFGVDLELTWRTVRDDLPHLGGQIAGIMQEDL